VKVDMSIEQADPDQFDAMEAPWRRGQPATRCVSIPP